MHRHRTHVFRDSRFLFRPFLISDDAGANLSAANGSVPSESRMHLYNCVTHHRSSVAAPSEQNVLDDHGSLPGSENDPPRRWSLQENDSAAQKRPTPIAVRRAPCCSRSHKSSEELGAPGRISEHCLRHFSSVRHSALGRYSSNSGPCCRHRWLSSLTPWREAFGAGASCITKT